MEGVIDIAVSYTHLDVYKRQIKTIKEIYGKFENLQMFPGMGADLSKRVSFRTDYKYAIWEDYVIIYKVSNESVSYTHLALEQVQIAVEQFGRSEMKHFCIA